MVFFEQKTQPWKIKILKQIWIVVLQDLNSESPFGLKSLDGNNNSFKIWIFQQNKLFLKSFLRLIWEPPFTKKIAAFIIFSYLKYLN